MRRSNSERKFFISSEKERGDIFPAPIFGKLKMSGFLVLDFCSSPFLGETFSHFFSESTVAKTT